MIETSEFKRSAAILLKDKMINIILFFNTQIWKIHVAAAKTIQTQPVMSKTYFIDLNFKASSLYKTKSSIQEIQ